MSTSEQLSLGPTQSRIEEVAANVNDIVHRIALSHTSSQHKTRVTPSLVAVSKTKPASDILALYKSGHRDFGENYIQELIEKAAILPNDIRWHFIGSLQSNKIKSLVRGVPNLYCLHTVDSIKKLDALNTTIGGLKPIREPLNVLVQVNTSGEDTKSGLEPTVDAVLPLFKHAQSSCPHIAIKGLMTIGSPENSRSDGSNPDFESLIKVRREVSDALGIDEWNLELSMGMTDDFEEAVKLGAKWVRIGSAIFGARNYSK